MLVLCSEMQNSDFLASDCMKNLLLRGKSRLNCRGKCACIFKIWQILQIGQTERVANKGSTLPKNVVKFLSFFLPDCKFSIGLGVAVLYVKVVIKLWRHSLRTLSTKYRYDGPAHYG